MSIRVLLISLLLVLSVSEVIGQNGQIGRWRNYQSHRQGVDISSRGNEVFGVSRAGLATLELVRYWYNEYTTLDGLSGGTPQKIYYDKTNNLMFIAYTSSVVDFFSDLDGIKTYRDIEQTRNFSRKQILDINSYNGLIYFATEFGIVVYDVQSNETRFTFRKIGDNPQDQPVTKVGFAFNRIYVVVQGNGLYSAPVNAPNLADGSLWRKESGVRELPEAPDYLMAQGSDRIYLAIQDSIYYLDAPEDKWNRLVDTVFKPFSIIDIHAEGKTLAILSSIKVKNTEGNEEFQTAITAYQNEAFLSFTGYNQPIKVHVTESEDNIAVTDRVQGVFAINIPGKFNFQNFASALPDNQCQNITVAERQLYIAPRGHDDFNTNSFNSSGIYYMNLKDRQWQVFNGSNVLLPDRVNSSFGVIESKFGSPDVYASSWDNGIVHLRGNTLVEVYDTTNSCLSGISTTATGKPTFIRPAGLHIDDGGNLWAVCNQATFPIVVITPEGECAAYPQPGGQADFVGITIDENGYKWIIVQRSGLLVYDDNRTIMNSRDDQWIRIRSGGGQGGLASNDVNIIVPDKQNSVWVGTTSGISVFYNPGAMFNEKGPPDATCPIFDFLCLLDGVEVLDIEIDGANQKWVATSGSGVFLFNGDGTTQIQQFTTSNSPLPSNTVLDIALDQESGEVFFATDEGIVSYQAVATEGRPDNSSLEAFPNPVFLEQLEYVLIRGTAAQTNIRIVTESGQLVRELVSEGGQTLWDGKDVQGKLVSPGVYFVLAALENGESDGIFKIAVLEKKNQN